MNTRYLFLAVLVLLMYSITLWSSSREGFESGKTESVEEPFDSFYASIYDALWNAKERIEYEEASMQDIMLADWATTNVNVLDMACGTAPHACFFKKLGVKYTGVDISADMIDKANRNCPSNFKVGDVTQASLFSPKSFSHAMLMNFAVYTVPNSKLLFDNAYLWLQPGGYLVVHMVDPDKFDPILDLSTPFAAFSLQKYSVGRKTDSEIYFDTFKYSGNFKKENDNDSATFEEVFTFYDTAESPNGIKYREQKQEWTMPSKERLIEIAKTSGFRHVEDVSLINAGKEYQYIVYFSK